MRPGIAAMKPARPVGSVRGQGLVEQGQRLVGLALLRQGHGFVHQRLGRLRGHHATPLQRFTGESFARRG